MDLPKTILQRISGFTSHFLFLPDSSVDGSIYRYRFHHLFSDFILTKYPPGERKVLCNHAEAIDILKEANILGREVRNVFLITA